MRFGKFFETSDFSRFCASVRERPWRESARASRLQFLRERAEHDSGGFSARTHAQYGCTRPERFRLLPFPSTLPNYFVELFLYTRHVHTPPSALRSCSARTLHFLPLNPARQPVAVRERLPRPQSRIPPFSGSPAPRTSHRRRSLIPLSRLLPCRRINRASSRVPITWSSSSPPLLLHRSVHTLDYKNHTGYTCTS